MAGPRQPTELVVLKGRKHLTKAEITQRRNSEPKTDKVKQVRAPVWLPKHLREEFAKLGRELNEIGLLSKLDFDILARYLMSRDAWVAAHLKARDALDMDDAKEAGTWSRVARTYFDQCQQCASSMGLTISSRCRLVVPKPPEDEAAGDPMTQMLRERAERRRKA